MTTHARQTHSPALIPALTLALGLGACGSTAPGSPDSATPMPAGPATAMGTPPAPPPAAPSGTGLAALAPVTGECTYETELQPGVPGSPGHLVPSAINPNGASELATIMRVMEADMKVARADVSKGAAVAPFVDRHRRMRCAWPTQPEQRTQVFDALAVGYLNRAEALGKAAAPEAEAAFEATLDACQACHLQSCPGPLEAIKALRVVPTAAP